MPKLRINPIACNGHGMCAELLPELLDLDDWGYPIIKTSEIPLNLLDMAKRAERICPTLAVMILEN
jgi:ferredoxin